MLERIKKLVVVLVQGVYYLGCIEKLTGGDDGEGHLIDCALKIRGTSPTTADMIQWIGKNHLEELEKVNAVGDTAISVTPINEEDMRSFLGLAAEFEAIDEKALQRFTVREFRSKFGGGLSSWDD